MERSIISKSLGVSVDPILDVDLKKLEVARGLKFYIQ